MIIQQARPANSTGRALELAALFIAIGNIASRLLGLGRVAAVELFFGRSAGVDADAAAWTVPNSVYDVLIAGVVSSALIPVLSEYAEVDAQEFRRLVGGVLALGLLALGLLVALLAWQAPLLVRMLVQSSRP